MKVRDVLRRPGYLVLTALIAVSLSALYSVLDLRAAGEGSGLLVFESFMTPGMMLQAYGGAFYFSALALNLVIAALLALTVTLSIARHRDRGAAAGAACSTVSSVFIGLSAFT